MRPVTTPPENRRGSRVSTPGRPFGICRNRPSRSGPCARPRSLPCGWLYLLGAWSDERIVNVPFLTPCHIAACSAGSSRNGGEHTHFAPVVEIVSMRDGKIRGSGRGEPSSCPQSPVFSCYLPEGRGSEGMSRHRQAVAAFAHP